MCHTFPWPLDKAIFFMKISFNWQKKFLSMSSRLLKQRPNNSHLVIVALESKFCAPWITDTLAAASVSTRVLTAWWTFSLVTWIPSATASCAVEMTASAFSLKIEMRKARNFRKFYSSQKNNPSSFPVTSKTEVLQTPSAIEVNSSQKVK